MMADFSETCTIYYIHCKLKQQTSTGRDLILVSVPSKYPPVSTGLWRYWLPDIQYWQLVVEISLNYWFFFHDSVRAANSSAFCRRFAHLQKLWCIILLLYFTKTLLFVLEWTPSPLLWPARALLVPLAKFAEIFCIYRLAMLAALFCVPLSFTEKTTCHGLIHCFP